MAETEWVFVDVDPETAEFPMTTKIGDTDVVIFQVGGKLRAIQRWCPHNDADLAHGRLMGDMIKCSLHGFMFRLTDGRGLNCPGINAEVFEAAAELGRIKVRRISS
jgi:nitrite reductase/ring-hydroxylating ferredoxin subunit